MLTLSTRAFTRPVLHLPKQPPRFWKKIFAHFGYPHTIVSDNATTFSSAEFQEWCHYRGIKHLTGAPYHPATNGAAERLVQSFKQSLKKSKLPSRPALQEFLMQYRRTPLNTGFSPSQLLMVVKYVQRLTLCFHHRHTSPRNVNLQMLQRASRKNNLQFSTFVPDTALEHHVTLCTVARDIPTHQDGYQPTVTKVHGTRSFTVKVHPRGPLWKRHWEQLRPRYGISEDADPGFNYGDRPTPTIDNSTPAPRRMNQPPSLLPTKPTNRQFQNTEDTIHGDLDVTGSHVTLVT